MGSEIIQQQLTEDFSEDEFYQAKDSVLELVARYFRPEFINQIDDIIVFHPLAAQQLQQIVLLQLQRLYQRLAGQGYPVKVSDALVNYLAIAGYDPKYGARPLKRLLQRYIEDPLAQQLLAGKLLPGQPIQLTQTAGKLVIHQEAMSDNGEHAT